MEVSIGVDCTDISRFRDKGEVFLKRIFTEAEIDYCTGRANPAQHFAARFAGKEAIIKAFSSAGNKISMKQIEILNNVSGAPVVHLPDIMGVSLCNVKLSLSHSKDIAIAMAIVTWENDSE